MSESVNYKLAKVSASIKTQSAIFDTPVDDPRPILKAAILAEPTRRKGENIEWAIGKVVELTPTLLKGVLARRGRIAWPHWEHDGLTEDILEAHPFCQFFYDVETQVIAFQ